MAVLVGSLPLHTNTTTSNISNCLFHFSSPFNPLLLTSRFHLRNPSFPPTFCLQRRLAPPLRSRPGRCLAAKPGRASPDSDPNPKPPRGTDLEASLSKFQDRAQIFFAVLFWMSLFFWTCAWDDKNRPNKGSRFRR